MSDKRLNVCLTRDFWRHVCSSWSRLHRLQAGLWFENRVPSSLRCCPLLPPSPSDLPGSRWRSCRSPPSAGGGSGGGDGPFLLLLAHRWAPPPGSRCDGGGGACGLALRCGSGFSPPSSPWTATHCRCDLCSGCDACGASRPGPRIPPCPLRSCRGVGDASWSALRDRTPNGRPQEPARACQPPWPLPRAADPDESSCRDAGGGRRTCGGAPPGQARWTGPRCWPSCCVSSAGWSSAPRRTWSWRSAAALYCTHGPHREKIFTCQWKRECVSCPAQITGLLFGKIWYSVSSIEAPPLQFLAGQIKRCVVKLKHNPETITWNWHEVF